MILMKSDLGDDVVVGIPLVLVAIPASSFARWTGTADSKTPRKKVKKRQRFRKSPQKWIAPK